MPQKSERYRHIMRGVWEHGHATYASWPPERRALAQPGVDALLGWLADSASEGDLIDRYMALGGPPGTVLLPHIGSQFTLIAAGVIEDECFWRRATAINGGNTDV